MSAHFIGWAILNESFPQSLIDAAVLEAVKWQEVFPAQGKAFRHDVWTCRCLISSGLAKSVG
jgi:hypothetical protein